MTEIGNGHKTPAIAIKKALKARFKGKYEVEVMDPIKKFDYKLFEFYRFLWIDLGMGFPGLLNVAYSILDHRFALTWESLWIKKLCEKMKSYVEETKPDLIVADHESCIHVFSLIKESLKVPFIAIDTDPFDAHYVWASQNIDKYLVFSDQAKDMLSKKGVNKKKIIAFNSEYPLDYKHLRKLDSKEKLRKKLGLLDKKTILIFSGAEGVGNIKEFALSVIKNNIDFQVVMLCGRNKNLKKEMEKVIVHGSKSNLKVFGFVNDIEEFIAASDIVLGKPGASQTFEVLIKNKPIIYSSYLRNELPTLEFVVENKFGWYVKNEKDFISLLEEIQKNPEILSDTSKKIKKFKIKSCSDKIARFLDMQVKKH